MTLKPWYAVATPHDDIQQGRLSEAVFAANLWAVAQNRPPELYTDPEAFFAKTYLTAGLANVLKKVAGALTGAADAGNRIISLQTSFGGGKTHALVALWHLARHIERIARSSDCAEVRNVLGSQLPQQVRGTAVFTHQTCDAVQGRTTPEGVHTQTLWGELALQLGGPELYRRVEANDRARTVPQGLFADILRQVAPCVILLDEIADYCVGAAAVQVGSTNLADQTISFIQQLTEAVQQVPGVAVVATLPASYVEVASSEKGQEILNRLERRFGRMGADVKPVADDEIYEVVRRRLFETLGDRAEHEQVADAYLKMYRQHDSEVPAEATRATYRDHILAAYPFHPLLIDALYLRWGSHGDFQRTRGVLRLLASIVGDLWQRRQTETQSQPLIQPCHVNWRIDALFAALTRLWGTTYESVVAADVSGERANAVRLDVERGGDYLNGRIGQGLAAAVLLGSFGGQGERAGFSGRELKLAVARPDLNWSYTDGALLELEERGFYLHTASAGSLGKRYWFGTKPTLTKLIVQYRAMFAADPFDAEVMQTLQDGAAGLRTDPATWRVVVNPQTDLPEQRALMLLVLPPECAYARNGTSQLALSGMLPAPLQRVLELSQKCGSRERLYRNTLLFLLPSARGLNRLRNALREVKVLEAVKRDYAGQLDAEQADDLKKRLEAANRAVGEQLGAAYPHIARVQAHDEVVVVDLADPRPSLADHLREAWRQLVEDEEWVLRRVGPITLQRAGLVPQEGGIRLKDAVEAFLRYTDKPMLATPSAVLRGVEQACSERVVGLGRGLTLANLHKKWCGEAVTLDLNEEGMWIIPPFEPVPVEKTARTDDGSTTTARERHEETGEQTSATGRPVRRVVISGAVPLESWADIFRCFINPTRNLTLKKLRLGIHFELEAPDDHPLDDSDPTLAAMRESARQLGLKLEEE